MATVWTRRMLLLFVYFYPVLSLKIASSDLAVLQSLKAAWPAAGLVSWTDPSECGIDYWGIACNGQGYVTNITLPESNLAGPLPESIGKLKFLQEIDLHSSKLNGPIPKSIGKLTYLQKLDLGNNNLTGLLPASYGGLPSLQILSLNGNKLTGTMPQSITGLKSIKELRLSKNRLAGKIPAGISNLRFLQTLDLSDNQLTGQAPISFRNPLQSYNVTGNYLTDLATPSSQGILACPANARNCITKKSPCKINRQRSTIECALFCRVVAGAAACSGHGYCFQAPGKKASCVCDPKFKPGAAPFTCASR